MNTLPEKLHKWSVQELNLVYEGVGKIPDTQTLKRLTDGKNGRIWNYVINHVRSESHVEKVKRILYFKKLLKEKCDGNFDDVSTDIAKYKSNITKATEKVTFLKRTLSTIEERILNLEQVIEKLNDETFKINQKTALFEHLIQKYTVKNSSLEILGNQISSYINVLHAYQATSMLFSQTDFTGSTNPKFGCENEIIVGDLINAMSSVIKVKCTGEDEKKEILHQRIQNNYCKLQNRSFLLTDLVILLKSMSDSAMQNFITSNLHNVPVNNFILNYEQRHSGKQLLTEIKYDFVSYSLSVKRNQNKLKQLQDVKTQIFNDKIETLKIDVDINCGGKGTLLETLAENEALAISNDYLEESIENISNKTEIYKQSFDDKFQNELSLLVQMFFKKADLAFHLLYSAPDAFQKILDHLNNLQYFTQNELFQSQTHLSEEHLKEIKTLFSSDKKLMWDYCVKYKMFELLPSEPCKLDSLLSFEVKKSLIFQSFENVFVICENWINLKRILQAQEISQTCTYEFDSRISAAEMYEKIMKMLNKMKISIEQGILLVNDGMKQNYENKIVLEDWWKQNAQFIPSIEYEGKSLEMWLDILKALSEFEPTNYSS